MWANNDDAGWCEFGGVVTCLLFLDMQMGELFVKRPF